MKMSDRSCQHKLGWCISLKTYLRMSIKGGLYSYDSCPGKIKLETVVLDMWLHVYNIQFPSNPGMVFQQDVKLNYNHFYMFFRVCQRAAEKMIADGGEFDKEKYAFSVAGMVSCSSWTKFFQWSIHFRFSSDIFLFLRTGFKTKHKFGLITFHTNSNSALKAEWSWSS